jgi:hypothetical protein
MTSFVRNVVNHSAFAPARHGWHPKSNWTTAEPWFSNTPDKQEAHPPKNRRQKEFLAKRPGELRSGRVDFPPKSPDSGNSRHLGSSLHFRISTFSVSALPKLPPFPRNPFFPRLRSGHRLFQRPSPGKQFPSNHLRTCLQNLIPIIIPFACKSLSF